MLNPSAADINFIDETESWKHNFQNNKARVEDALFVVLDGLQYCIDNQNIKLDYTIHEKEIACLLSKITGKTIIMQPKISGKLLGFSWPDYLIEGQRWELKDLFSGKSKYLLRDKVHKSAKQAENYVFDITHSVVSEYELMNQAEALFVYYNTLHVKTIVIVKDGIIKRVLIRKESLPDPQVEKGQTL